MAHQTGTLKVLNSGKLNDKKAASGGRSIMIAEYAGPTTYKDATGANSWQVVLPCERAEHIIGCEIRLKYDGSGDEVAEATQLAGTQYRAHIIAISTVAGSKNLATIMVTTLAGVQVADDVNLTTYAVTITFTGV